MSAVHRGRVAGVLAMVLLGAASSQAAPVSCAGQTFTPAMTVNDMTFGSPATAATACAWSTDNQAHNLAAINSQWQNWPNPPATPGLAFVELAKWDTGNPGTLTSHSAFGFTWALASIPAATSGQYALTATAISPAPAGAVTLPHIFDFVGVLKGGSGAGSWFFDDRLFNSPGGGTWQINFRNNGNNIPDLSHLSIFGRSVGAPPAPPPPPNGVPSPGTLPLVGLALLAGWLAARRRSWIG